MTGCERRHNVRYFIIPAQTSAFDVSIHTRRERENGGDGMGRVMWSGVEWNGIKRQQQHTQRHIHSSAAEQLMLVATAAAMVGSRGKRKRPKGIAANRENREVYEPKKVGEKGKQR